MYVYVCVVCVCFVGGMDDACRNGGKCPSLDVDNMCETTFLSLTHSFTNSLTLSHAHNHRHAQQIDRVDRKEQKELRDEVKDPTNFIAKVSSRRECACKSLNSR